MKVTIDGHHFDTQKASHYWDLEYFDQSSNRHTGTLYRSSKGIWYVYTPSQWTNQHSWQLIEPVEALTDYDKYLEDKEKTEIAELAGLDWE